MATDIGIDVDVTEGRRHRTPFQIGQWNFSRGRDQFWFQPIRVIAAGSIATVVDDQDQFLGVLKIDVDVGCRLSASDFGASEAGVAGFRFLGEERLLLGG